MEGGRHAFGVRMGCGSCVVGVLVGMRWVVVASVCWRGVLVGMRWLVVAAVCWVCWSACGGWWWQLCVEGAQAGVSLLLTAAHTPTPRPGMCPAAVLLGEVLPLL